MIRHSIMWKITDEYEGMTKNEIMDKLFELFSYLKKTIPEIRTMTLERDVLHTERSYDLVYITEFDSLEALEIYRVHPEHVKVAQFVAAVRTAQAVTDSVVAEIK